MNTNKAQQGGAYNQRTQLKVSMSTNRTQQGGINDQ
jgi:hypothetical protein